MLIVLAEDDRELRSLVAAALELDGHRVIQASAGASLVDEVRKIGEEGRPLDLLISDVGRPEDGLDTLRAIRRNEADLPVIFVTCFGDMWTRAEAARHGALLLDKPVELGRLRAAVRDVDVERARARAEVAS